MTSRTTAVVGLVGIIGLLTLAAPTLAHHGTASSYDMEHPWTTKVVVTEFRYANPHPQLFFDRTNEKGEVEHWASELRTNPSRLVRDGWTKSRSVEALKPGTMVTLTLCTSRAGGHSAVVTRLQNEQGEDIVGTGRQGGGGNAGRGGN